MKNRKLKGILSGIYNVFEQVYKHEPYYQRSKKIRRYEDIDISKDFEKKYTHYMNTKLSELEDFYKKTDQSLIGTNALATEEKSSKAPALSPSEVEDIRSKVLITGFKKDIVLGTIKYYSQCNRLFPEFRLHPETEKLMEKIAYGVEYGMPVEKELLFKALPELFTSEIRRLKDEEQHKYLKPKLELGYAENPGIAESKKHLLEKKMSNQEMLQQKIWLMKMYHWDQVNDLCEYYSSYLEEQAVAFGYPNGANYLSDLLIIDEVKLTDVEKRIVNEVRALQKIQEDIRALEIRSTEITPADLETLPFPILDPKLRDEIIRYRKYILKFGIHDIKDVPLFPYK